MKLKFLPDGPMVNVSSMVMGVPKGTEGSVELTLTEGGTISIVLSKGGVAPFSWAGESYDSVAIMDDSRLEGL